MAPSANAQAVWVSPDGTATIAEGRTDSGWRRVAPPAPYTPTEEGDWARPAPIHPRGYAADIDPARPHRGFMRPERGQVMWDDGPIYYVRSQTHYVSWHREEEPRVIYKYIEKPAKKKPVKKVRVKHRPKPDTIRCTCK